MPNKVAIIGTNYPEFEKYCPNWFGMQAGLRRMGIQYQLFSCRPKLNLQEIVEYAPDLIIYGLLDMVKDRNSRLFLREKLPNAKIVLWYGDYRDERTGQISADLSEIDAMFVSNDAQSDFYKEQWKVPDCHFLPLGSELYEPRYNSLYHFSFVFIGGIMTLPGYQDRASDIIRFKRYGLKQINGEDEAARAKVFRMMPSIYRSSKISLDQSHFTDVQGYTSNRHWIITGSGGFALSKRYPGCEEFYPEGTRVYFDTFEEALELKDKYMSDSIDREKIRAAGHEHAKLHTYDKRFEKMFAVLYSL